MNRSILYGVLALAAASLPVNAAPNEEVQGAIKKLADTGNYAWKSTVETAGGGGGGGGGGGPFRIGPTEGKIDSNGYILLTMTRGDNEIEAVVKGDKGAVKTPEGWSSLSELAEAGGGGGGGRGGRMWAFMLRDYKAPAAQAKEILAGTKNLKRSGDVYTGELTEEAVVELMPFGRMGNAPPPRNAKGTVKFWVKDGALSKYEYQVQGVRTFNNNDVNMDRTTTVEIKEVGNTKVSVPEEAKRKLAI